MVDKKLVLFLVIGMIGIFFSFTFVLAHLDSGRDITKNGHIIDFGFAPSEVVSLSPTNFAINLVNSTTEEPINLTSIWVRISSPKEIVFSGEFFPKNASLPFTYTFPTGGNYSLDFQFKNKEMVVEKQTFYLDVKDANSVETVYYIIGLVVLFLLLFLKSFYLRKKLKEKLK